MSIAKPSPRCTASPSLASDVSGVPKIRRYSVKPSQIDDLHAHYGKSHVLHGVSFTMAEPAIVSLLGRNGTGRSTALKAMMGWLRPSRGSVRLRGRELAGRNCHAVAR